MIRNNYIDRYIVELKNGWDFHYLPRGANT